MRPTPPIAGPEPGSIARAAVAGAIVVIAATSGGYPAEVLGALGVAVWLSVLVSLTLAAGEISAPRGPAAWLLGAGAAYAGWTAASLGWASDLGSGVEDLVRALTYLGGIALVVLWARGRARPLAEGVLGGLGVVVVLALVLRALGLESSELERELPAVDGRLSAPVGYWNALGFLAASCVLLALWIAGHRDAGSAGFGAALVVVALPVLALTESLGAAAGLAVGIVCLFALDRRAGPGAGALLAGICGAAPAVALIGLSGELREVATDGPYWAGLGLLAACVLGALAAARAAAPLARRFEPLRLAGRRLLAAAVAAGIVLVGLLVGPGGLASGDDGAATGADSGRVEFWSAALDAAAEEPLAGIGAGGFENWWNAEGTLAASVENAHSAPLETLAELGGAGLGLLGGLVAIVVVAVLRWARERTGDDDPVPAAGAVLGCLAVGLLFDWLWEMPAVMAVAAVLAALACVLSPGAASPGRIGRREPVHAALTAAGAAAAIAGIALSAALAIGAERLSDGREALARGDVVAAAGAAREADRFIPWSSEPELLEAEIEQLAGNLDAAARLARRAVRQNPADYRGWLLLASVRGLEGEEGAAAAYLRRASMLGERVLRRALLEQRVGRGNLR